MPLSASQLSVVRGTSTSLNRSGDAPARDLEAARDMVAAADGASLDAPLLIDDVEHDAGGETPSSVVDCTGEVPKILRAGAIDSDELESVWSLMSQPAARKV